MSSTRSAMTREIGPGPVGLEHGELGVVAPRDAFVAEVAVQFEHLRVAADQQTLEVQFRCDAQVELHVERVVVRGKRPGRRTAGTPASSGVSTSRKSRVLQPRRISATIRLRLRKISRLFSLAIRSRYRCRDFFSAIGHPVPLVGQRAQAFERTVKASL
jgi:hypothetical protein